MTLTRAALSVGGGLLVAAWFSSAASLSLPRNAPTQPAPGPAAPHASFDQVAAGMRAGSERLRERLAAAPRPQRTRRNPFAFESAAPPPVTRPRDVPVGTTAPAPAEPVLLFIGIAEARKGADLVRTAIMATDADELILADAGDVLLGRYKVETIGFEAIELSDLTTGLVRRLFLQNN